jgi:hypothetical protein
MRKYWLGGLLLGGCITVCAQDAANAWLKLSGEFRARGEFARSVAFEPKADDSYYLNRVRLLANLEPRDWFRIAVQVQDARAPGITNADGFADRADLRQAYLALGRAGGGWELRLGRQELSLGDERLVAADSFWDPLGRSWDAASLAYRRGDLKLTWLAAYNVAPLEKRLNRPAWHDRIYGFVATLPKAPGGIQWEPYFLFDELLHHQDDDGPLTSERIATFGTRALGVLPARFDYNFEAAFQCGRHNSEPVEAGALHGEVSRQFGAGDRAPRAGLEYNYATGDHAPGDGRHTTFDDAHPAGYNKWGTSDPFALRNTHAGAISLEWKAAHRWKLLAGYRSFWLATRADGLYTAGESFLALNPAASSNHAGNQINAMATFTYSERWQLYFGYGRFFPGTYLAESGFDGPLSTPFVMLNFRF